MKKRLILPISAILCILLAAAGCGGNQQANQENTAGEQNGQKTSQVLSLGTHPMGSLVNSLGTGIATVISKHASGLEVKAIATSGPSEWFPMIGSQEMDLGVLNSWDAVMGLEGKHSYEKTSGGQGFPIRLLTSGHKSLIGIMVEDGSSIKDGQDLKGQRYVAEFTGSEGITAQSEATLANFGLTIDDIIPVAVPSITSGVQAVNDGRAKGVSVSLGTSAVTEFDAQKGARFLSFDPSPEALARMQEKYPGTLVQVEPSPDNVGIKEPTYLFCYDFYLVSREDLADELAYQAVKMLWENNKELTAINYPLHDWTTENFLVADFTIPFHPGAVKFYQEMNVWTPEMEQRQQELLSKVS